VSNITAFFITCKRGQNDFTNKIRENIISVLNDPPKEYFQDSDYGKYWMLVHNEYTEAIKTIVEDIDYNSTKITQMGGRKFNYDFDLMYYKDDTIVATRKVEFKNGSSNLSKLPQFLSLPSKSKLFETSYDIFWYEHYLDKYTECDSEITEKKPPLEDYLKKVCSTVFSVSPFFLQLKQREKNFMNQKNKVVNESITAYLTKYGKDVNIEFFKEKLKSSQDDKIFLMWSKSHRFCIDTFLESEKNDITYHSIKRGNAIQLQSGTTMYSLLLRWKNHKGILNPAWQISMKRNVKK
jgi:hypothetical protein